MKKLAVIGLMAIGLAGFGYAHAETVSPADAVVLDANQIMLGQLAELQADMKDAGPISRFFIKIKIRELENKLNLKKALQ